MRKTNKEILDFLGLKVGDEIEIKRFGGTLQAVAEENSLRLTGGLEVGFDLILNESAVYKILPKAILDDTEKEYLHNLVNPFRRKVEYVLKHSFKKLEYISIRIEDDACITLPCFKAGTMYQRMEVDKEYALEELGI